MFMASSPSSKLMSGVVLTALAAPPAEIAMDRAAALTLSGSSQIISRSYSPNMSQPLTMEPPSRSITGLIASSRCWGSFSSAAQPRGV